MMHEPALDRQDIRILEMLLRDSRIPRLELAEAVNLSASQCFRRLKRLEESGLIERYTIVLNKEKAGFDVSAMVMIQFNKFEDGARAKLVELIEQTSIIDLCYSVTGESDFLLKVSCSTMKEFNTLINQTFATSFISSVHSYMLLDCIKDRAALPASHS